MTLLSFPPSPSNGDLYPTSPSLDQNQYVWEAANQTWRLLGVPSGVTPGTYGAYDEVPVLTFDLQGRTVSASDTYIGDRYIQTNATTAFNAYTWPISGGDSGNALTSDGSGNLAWCSSVDIPCSIITNKGDLIAGAAPGFPVALPVGINRQYLIACSACTTGLAWTRVTANTIQILPPINGNTGLQAVLEDAVYNVSSPNLTVTEGLTGQVAIEIPTSGVVPGSYDYASITVSDLGIVTSAVTNNSSSFVVSPPINGNTSLQAVLEDAVYNVSSPNLTVTETLTGQVAIEIPTSGVVPGAYKYANVTVSDLGIVTSATGNIPQYIYFDDITPQFDGVLTSFGLTVAGGAFPPIPSTNILVVVGGIPQSPVSSYSVTGSTITFTSPPPTGASFMASTIG